MSNSGLNPALRIPDLDEGRERGPGSAGRLRARSGSGARCDYCKLSWVSLTAQRVPTLQVPTVAVSAPCVVKYTLEACAALLTLSTIIPLTPPGYLILADCQGMLGQSLS